jgi:hypothetical protein
MKRLYLILVSALFMVGCATGYHPGGLTGGYSDIAISENVFQVSFAGNGYTSAGQASDFALLRCAELALDHGFSYFILVDANQMSSISSYTTPTTSRTTGSATVYGNTIYGTSRTTTTGGQTYNFVKPSATNTIMCFVEKPDLNATIYDARIVSASIRSKRGIR